MNLLSAHDDLYNHGAGRSIFSNVEEESHRDPVELLKEYNTLTEDRSSVRDKLKGQLMDALGDSSK